MVLHIKDDGLGNKKILTEKEFQNEKSLESLNELAGVFSTITKPLGIIAGICMFMYMMYQGVGSMSNTFEVVFFTLLSIIIAILVGVAAYLFIIPVAALALLGLIFTVSDKIFFADKKNPIKEKPIYKNGASEHNLFLDSNKSYKELRNEILSSGWSVYKRNNEIKDWYKYRPYPELDYCSEDVCQASFINNDNTKVRKVIYGHCSPDGYVACPNKPRGFELPQKDIIISKSDSDIEFLRIKQRFED